MKNCFKKYIPIALLATSLGLGFNVGCEPRKPKQTIQRELIERTIRTEDDKRYVMENKEYLLNNIFYVEQDDKSFSISSKVKVLEDDNSKEFNVNYFCSTNIDGEFYKDSLSLKDNPDPSNEIIIHAIKNYTSSEYEIILVTTWIGGENIDMVGKTSMNREVYFKFGKEKLQLYNKLFDIENRKKQAKGKNLCSILDEMDISGLTVKDFKYDSRNDVVTARKGKLKVFADSRPEYAQMVIHYDKSDETGYHPDFDRMGITDSDNDGRTDIVRLNDTRFKKENGTYKYIKDLYTEEQVKEIFRNADQKLKLVDETKKQIKIQKQEKPEKKNNSGEILEQFK